MSRTLHVRKTSREEVEKKWNITLPRGDYDFVRCNSKGQVNWDAAPVYSAKELVGRDRVVVLEEAKDADRTDS